MFGRSVALALCFAAVAVAQPRGPGRQGPGGVHPRREADALAGAVLSQVFGQLDANHDGKLDAREMRVPEPVLHALDAGDAPLDESGFTAFFPRCYPRWYLFRAWGGTLEAPIPVNAFPGRVGAAPGLDADGDGRVTYVEFLKHFTGPGVNAMTALLILLRFDPADRNGDGTLEGDEVRAFSPGLDRPRVTVRDLMNASQQMAPDGQPFAFLFARDANLDFAVDARELAPTGLDMNALDRDGDGVFTMADLLTPPRPPGPMRGGGSWLWIALVPAALVGAAAARKHLAKPGAAVATSPDPDWAAALGHHRNQRWDKAAGSLQRYLRKEPVPRGPARRPIGCGA